MQKRISGLNFMQTFAFSKQMNLRHRKGSAKFRKLIEAEIVASPRIVCLLAGCCYCTNVTESRQASGDVIVPKSIATIIHMYLHTHTHEPNRTKQVNAMKSFNN